MVAFSIVINLEDEEDWIDRGSTVKSIDLFCHEDQSSNPNTHIRHLTSAHDSSSKRSVALLWTLGACMHTCGHTLTDTHINKINLLKNNLLSLLTTMRKHNKQTSV